jgi:MFS family permease
MPESVPLRRQGKYVRFRLARFASLLGSQLTAIAYPLLVLSIGGSAVQAGAVASAWLILRAACQLPGGHIADRFDRRTLMIAMDAVRFAAVATIPLAAIWHGVTYPQLLAVAVIDSSGSAVFDPATSAFLRDVVPKAQLTEAWGHAQVVEAAISLLGPAMAGILFQFSHTLPFALDASSYAVSGLLLLRLAVPPSQKAGTGADRRMTAGLRWLWTRPGMMRVLLFVGIINLVGEGASVAVIVSLREHGVHATAIGFVLACGGAGGIAGTVLARRITRWLGPGRLLAAVGVIWSAGFAVVAVAPDAYVIGPVLALLFTCAPAAAVMLGTITVGEAPRDLLGRVSTAEKVGTATLATVGPMLATVGLQTMGVSPTWLVMCGCCTIATVFLTVSPGAVTLPRALVRTRS